MTHLLRRSWLMLALILVSTTTAQAQFNGLATDSKDPTLPIDFQIQGEYVGEVAGGGKLGCQVIALSKGALQAVVYPGGLPGAGWDGKNKIVMDGRVDGDKANFEPAKGDKKYLGKSPEQFSATKNFPPVGQKDYSAQVADGNMTGETEAGKAFHLKKIVRKASSMGAKPPKGAIVLFDGTSADAFQGGRLDEKTKLLNTDGKDIRTKKKFNNYVVHVEFMLPYRPAARGQGRGNSGFYQVDQYEVQILDSFGLAGLNNECGGVYQKADSLVNMCLPPLTWQCYDIEFTNAVAEDGKKVKNAILTAKLNGVVIHDKLDINGKTGGSRNEPEGTPGVLKLQGHGNPLQYRNIWIIEE
jgi:hypothetical protein